MPKIPTMLHAAGDYANGALLLVAPRVLPIRDRRAQALAVGAGAATLTVAALTDYELGIRRRIPVPVHLLVDAVAGGLMIAAGARLQAQKGTELPDWLPFVVVGAGEIAAAGLTERAPRRRRRRGPGADGAAPPSVPTAASGISAGAPAAVAPPVAPPPIETPGPSVTAPAQPESDTELRERIEANLPGDEASQTGDDLVAREEAAAAAEAAGIGGSVPHGSDDPAMDPVLQAGGGEQDGWEMAEAELVENATHGDGGGQPERDAFTPESESDRATAVYGEADEIPVSEVVEDQATPHEDAGRGPGLAADR